MIISQEQLEIIILATSNDQSRKASCMEALMQFSGESERRRGREIDRERERERERERQW